MPILQLHDMAHHARQQGYALAAFEITGLESLSGCIAAAEALRAPLILHLREQSRTPTPSAILLPAIEAAARRATIPVAIQLDQVTTPEGAIHGIRHGCNGIAVDGSPLALNDNIALTREVVQLAHGCDVVVEGTLGTLPGASRERHLTDPAEAERFVQESGVDLLAVAIGTAHGRPQGGAQLDYPRLQQLAERLSTPLVIHGGSGLDSSQIEQLVAHGAAKINFFTALDVAAGSALDGEHGPFSQRSSAVINAITREAERAIRYCGAVEQAPALLATARPVTPVEHLIVYNLAAAAEPRAEELMAHGRECLATIPGVRSVATGQAIQENAKYRYCWLVRFSGPSVIPGYRDHPTHVAYADQHFRPNAADRISIDFLVES